jgi:hypothetical protein
MRRALVLFSTLAVGCSAAFGSISLGQVVRLHEEHDLVRSDMVVTGNSHFPFLLRLAAHARGRGIRVVAGDMCKLFPEDCAAGDTVFGYYEPAEDNAQGQATIYLEKSQEANMMVSTLAHELGHHYQPEALTGEMEGQAFAEAVGFLVCRAIGLDTTRQTVAYLSLSQRQYLWVLDRYSREIDAAAAAIVKDVTR